ncbi:unnamed protein product [Calypogeia fissa]
MEKFCATVHWLPNYPSALEKRAFAIQQKLGVSPVLGIVGMGGIGKTTLAKQLFNTLSQQFDYTCFVDNVKDVRIHELNDWVLGHFLQNGTRLEQNSLKWSDLQNKKALITMDDVNSDLQLKILPRLNELGNGSLLILTTRDQGVLDTFPNCVIYDVEFLNFEEAKEHAFEQEEIPKSLVKMNQRLGGIVENVVRKCDGLPLTLEVMGSYLKKHKTDATVWKQTLDKLEKAQAVTGLRDDRVWASLRINYDALSDEEKGMFIEAGTYFFQQRLELALAAWSTAYEYSELGGLTCSWTGRHVQLSIGFFNASKIRFIKTSDYVIKAGIEHEGREYKEVWVHEHLRDLAKKEAKGAVNLFNANAVEEDTTMLQLSLKKGCPKLSLESLDKLENVKWLARLPDNFGQLPHLKRLVLKSLNMAALPQSFGNLSALEYLQMSDVTVVELPESIGNPSSLVTLLFDDCEDLASLPESFGNLSSLATLAFRWCFKLASLPESFGKLPCLTTLVFEKCTTPASLPESFACLSSLVLLGIHDCIVVVALLTPSHHHPSSPL